MKTIQENLKLFYVGLKNKEPFFYKNKDLTTHAAIIGMTGSGKTGLGISILEEACIDNIPTFIIDPKGDMTNLALAFPQMSAQDFAPYVDENEAQNKGMSADEFAASEAQTWKNGIEGSFQSLERVGLFKDSAGLKIYTPKSGSGVGVALLGDFARPSLDAGSEEFGEYVGSLASSVLSLVGIENDVNSKEHLLISNIFIDKFSRGADVSLEELIGFIATPPFAKIGVFDVEKFYPSSERMKLAVKINTLLASPDFRAWLSGERLDISKMLFNANGKAKCNIFTISHLKDGERMFFVTLLLNEIIAWMRKTEGTSSLRAVLYMDEIFGFFPPNGNPPSKTPMLTLLKQARAHGLGVILSTQNPVDLDYKGLSNIGTWFIGRLQTAQDKARVIDGMTGLAGSAMDKGEIENLISNLQKRNFLLKNIHEDGLSVISTRWALSYLKGPLSREQISNLMSEKKQNLALNSGVSGNGKISAAREPRPIISGEIEQIFDACADGGKILKPNLLGTAKVRFYDAKKSIDETRDISYLYALEPDDKSADWSQASEGVRLTFGKEPANAGFAQPPGFVTKAKNFKDLERDFKDFIFRNYALELYNALDLHSKPGESREEFYVRLSDKCNEILETASAKLTAKYEKERANLEAKLERAELKLQKEQKDAVASGLDAAINIGASLLGALFGGKSRASLSKVASGARSANRVLKERGDVKISEQSVSDLQEALDALTRDYEQQAQALKDANDPRNLSLEVVKILPKKSDIYDEKVALLWR